MLDWNLDFVADDSVLSGETHSWKVEGENAPGFLPPTLAASVPPRAAGASAARGGALPALPVGPSIGGGQAAAASIAWPPPPPVPGFYADAQGVYGHRAAAYPGGRPVAAYTAGVPFSAVAAGQSICGGPAAAAAGPPPAVVSAAAAAGASGRPPAANPALPPFSAAGAGHRAAASIGAPPLSYAGAAAISAALGSRCGVGELEAATAAAPGPGGPPSGAQTILETLMTPAAAAPATPERDERGRPRPSPASGERPPGPKRGRHGQDTQGVAKALDYAETPAVVRAMLPPDTAPAAEPSVTVESLRLSTSRPREGGTPPTAPPKKRSARASAAGAQAPPQDQQAAAAARQLGYAAPARGYCISFSITWRNAESMEHDRLAARHAIRHSIATWGARQTLGCTVVGKSQIAGLDFHIYGIHGDTVTLEVLDGIVKRVKDNALAYPRRSKNPRVSSCRFRATVERKLSLPEAEVIDRIGGGGLPHDCERWCKVPPREQAPPAPAVSAEGVREGAVAAGEAPAGLQTTPAAATAGLVAKALASELQVTRVERDAAISPAAVVSCFDRVAQLLDCAIWFLSELPNDSRAATGGGHSEQAALAGPGPFALSAGLRGSGSGVGDEAAAQLLPPPSASVSSGRVPLVFPIRCFVSGIPRRDTDTFLVQGQLRRRGLGPRRRLPGLPAGTRPSRCLPAPLGPTRVLSSLAALGTTPLGVRQRQRRQQVPQDACPSKSSCSVKVSDRAHAGFCGWQD